MRWFDYIDIYVRTVVPRLHSALGVGEINMFS